jgi:flavodoxin
MNTVIYYFSGTGNSYSVARDIAKELDGVKIPIIDVINEDAVIPDFDIIGIVFPVYNAVVQGMPVMVKKFAEKLENINSKYVFVICTCLGWSHTTITKFDTILKVKGGKLSAGFTVIMPDNSSPVPTRKQEKIFNNWAKKREVISHYVKSKKEGDMKIPLF